MKYNLIFSSILFAILCLQLVSCTSSNPLASYTKTGFSLSQNRLFMTTVPGQLGINVDLPEFVSKNKQNTTNWFPFILNDNQVFFQDNKGFYFCISRESLANYSNLIFNAPTYWDEYCNFNVTLVGDQITFQTFNNQWLTSSTEIPGFSTVIVTPDKSANSVYTLSAGIATDSFKNKILKFFQNTLKKFLE